MKIAINTRFLLSHKMEGFGWYTYEIVRRIVKNHPEHQFFFFFDRPFDEKFIFSENVTPVVLSPQARHPFLFYIWFEISVAKALNKYEIDLFFSPDGYLSLNSEVKQICTIHDINFEHNPEDLTWLVRKYYRYFFPKFARKSEHILTVSEYSKKDIIETYGIPEKKVTAVWNGASDVFQPLQNKDKRQVRENYANGKEYFLFVGALSPRKNLKRLIQAFTLFKKRNSNSDIQLVIVGEELWKKSNHGIKINDSVKNQIHFTGHIPLVELAKVIGSAKLFTYVPYFEGFGIPLVEAMKCGTPILSGDRTSLPEVAGDAGIYCDPYDAEDIANKMQMIIKDDSLLNSLSQKGLQRCKEFSWDIAAEKVWKVIESLL